MPRRTTPPLLPFEFTFASKIYRKGFTLYFYLMKDVAKGSIDLIVSKEHLTHLWVSHFSIMTFNKDGTCVRNTGLPEDWDIALVEGNKILEKR